MIARRLLEKLEHFTPVIRELVGYALEVDRKADKGILPRVLSWTCKDSVYSDMEFMKEWTGYILTNSIAPLSNWQSIEETFAKLPQGITSYYQPIAAARCRNLAVVRQYKESIDTAGESARRSIVLASCILSQDEKRHWLGRFDSTSDPILKACVRHSLSNDLI